VICGVFHVVRSYKVICGEFHMDFNDLVNCFRSGLYCSINVLTELFLLYVCTVVGTAGVFCKIWVLFTRWWLYV
jgi:hypothetical protein